MMFHFRSIRARLIATYVLLIILPIGVVSGFLLQWLATSSLDRLQSDMNVEAGIISRAVAEDMLNGRTVEAKTLLSSPPALLTSQARVFLFDPNGTLIGASDAAFSPELGRLLSEPGLEAALSGHEMRGIQISPTTRIPVVYVAQPVVGGGQVIGAVHLSYSLVETQRAINRLRLLVAAVLGIVVALASLVGMRLVRSITEPLARISTAAADIAGGRFDHRVSEAVPGEMVPLSQSFNRMAEALEKAEHLRQMTFANIAHDVRTPLASIRAAAEALNSGAIDQPALRDLLLNGLIEQTRYLGRLSSDLLRLATYEGGGMVLHCAPVDAGMVIRQAVRGVELRAQQAGVDLQMELPANLPLIWADSDRVLEILFNLLENALTYTPRGGQIRVWAQADAGMAAVHVSDSGPCIPVEILPNLFQRYWRGDYRRADAGVNMGLGLNIVHELVSAHGGTIGVRNLAEGPDFFFCIPVGGDPAGSHLKKSDPTSDNL